MSLINDALKKAQRLRNEEPMGTQPPMSGAGGPRVAKRSQPRTSQQVVMLAAAALVVVVLSVVVTVWLVNRPAAPKPAPPVVATPAKPKPATDAPPPATTPAPVIASLANKPATTPLTEAPAPKPAEPASPNIITLPPPALLPAPAAPITTASEPTATPSLESKPAVAPPPPAAEPKPDERIHAFVDSIRVTGIRSSGDDSRVLMNDRVFRVNDIVDRGLGVRLTKVNPNSLTFTDANGATYVKNF